MALANGMPMLVGFAAENLIAFLAVRDHSLPPHEARLIVTELYEAAQQDSTRAARLLASRLADRSIHLQHTHALHALSHVLGYPNWMRVIREENIVTPVHYEVRFWQGDVETHDTFKSLGQAVHHLFNVAFAALPRREPGLIELHKKKSLLRLEIWHATVESVTIYLEKFRTDTPKPERESYNATDLRGAVNRIIRGFERARPSMLIDGGSLSETFHSFYTAVWHVKGGKDTEWNGEIGASPVSERYLFERFIETGIHTFTYEAGIARFEGKADWLDIKQVWRDQFYAGDGLRERKSPDEKDFELLMNRYLRWIRAQPCSVEELHELMYFGPEWKIDTNKDAIENLLKGQNLSLISLAEKMGVPFRNVESMNRGNGVSTSFFLKLASVLRVGPEAIARADGYKHAVDSADCLIHFVDDVQELREVISLELDETGLADARRTMQEVRSLILGKRELANSPAGTKEKTEKNAALTVRAAQILDRAATAGLALRGRHETSFVQTRSGSQMNVDAIRVLILFTEPKASTVSSFSWDALGAPRVDVGETG